MTSLIENVVETIVTWHTRRRTIGELRALNDHVLKDIGISRSEIHAVADGLITGR